jgi:hypothetical protein
MATVVRTTKLDDDLTVSAIGFGAGALASGMSPEAIWPLSGRPCGA